MLLLHGYTDSWRSFELILPHLPSSVRAIAPSQRGHGDADRPASGYGAADLAADAVALMDALGLDRAVVAGHSMGSLVAQRVALDHPGRVRGLVLLGAFATLRGNPAVRELWGVPSRRSRTRSTRASCGSSRRARWPGRCRGTSSTPPCARA